MMRLIDMFLSNIIYVMLYHLIHGYNQKPLPISTGDRLIKEEHDYVQFNCKISGNHDSKYKDKQVTESWYKHLLHHGNRNFQISNGTTILTPFNETDRYSIVLLEHNGVQNLQININNIRHEDSGVYSCDIALGPLNPVYQLVVIQKINYLEVFYARSKTDKIQCYSTRTSNNCTKVNPYQPMPIIKYEAKVDGIYACRATGGQPRAKLSTQISNISIDHLLMNVNENDTLMGKVEGLQFYNHITTQSVRIPGSFKESNHGNHSHWEKENNVKFSQIKWNSSLDGQIITCTGKVGQHIKNISLIMQVIGFPVIDNTIDHKLCNNQTLISGPNFATINCQFRCRPECKKLYWNVIASDIKEYHNGNSELISIDIDSDNETIFKSPHGSILSVKKVNGTIFQATLKVVVRMRQLVQNFNVKVINQLGEKSANLSLNIVYIPMENPEKSMHGVMANLSTIMSASMIVIVFLGLLHAYKSNLKRNKNLKIIKDEHLILDNSDLPEIYREDFMTQKQIIKSIINSQVQILNKNTSQNIEDLLIATHAEPLTKTPTKVESIKISPIIKEEVDILRHHRESLAYQNRCGTRLSSIGQISNNHHNPNEKRFSLQPCLDTNNIGLGPGPHRFKRTARFVANSNRLSDIPETRKIRKSILIT